MTAEQLVVGSRIWFSNEKLPYTVQARSSRFVVCTKPFAARHTVLYTVIDLQKQVRGVDNSIGNSLGYETRRDCEDALVEFETGVFGHSQRHQPIPLEYLRCL